jgi:peptidyl-prolyl cis-trans isomerase A (cyclophilin A)
VHRDWAPKGADRFYNLVKNSYYDGARFFRVVPRFMVQFGIHGDPSVQKAWRQANIPDDPVKQSNKRGFMTFATAGPGTRTTQVFINFKDNVFLDAQGFAPFGQVLSGMEAVDKINAQYGQSPDQAQIQARGDLYLTKFPKLDYVTKATIVK